MSTEAIAHFRLVRKLGQGGMGQVWLAEDLRLSRQVALKVLPEFSSENDRQRKALLQEARTAAGLMHPNICVIYEAAESPEGIPYISMERIEGQSLKDKIGSSPLPTSRIVAIGAQIADALSAAHQKGIIHRDVKPGNVIITPDDRVKVLDFGLAKVIQDSSIPSEDTAVQSRTGAVAGTAAYMSPEQALGRKVDHRTDIFSLGVVLYEMATARRPFDAQSLGEAIYRTLEAEPESVRRINPLAPLALQTIIEKCLQKDPDKRYQTASELAADLQALGRPADVPRRRNRWALAGLGAGLLILAIVFGFLARGRLQPDGSSPVPTADAVTVKSIAVMPFLNMSADKENEYFSDGLTEEILNALAQVKGLRVAARTSSFQFKGVSHNITDIGRKLNVETVLEGSVRKAGNKLRVTAQLIDVSDGYHLWSKTYDRELEDVFAIQNDVSMNIVSSLMPRFSGAGGGTSVKNPTEDVEAYEFYLQGRYQFWQGGTEENLRRAAAFFERAVEKDPQFALAYAGLSDAYMLLGGSGYAPPKAVFPQSKAAAQRALDLNDRLAEGYVALASINWLYDWDWKSADRNYRRSFSVNPLLHTRCVCYVWYLAAVGNLDVAIIEAERARDMDPLARLPRAIVSWMYYFAGRDA